jgi:hypothetical protein
MAEVDTASAITASVSTAVTYAITPAVEIDSAGQVFNPLVGYWLSDPLTLPGNPVTGSVVRWTETTPVGTAVLVETSINAGASWDLAVNDQPVPRLLQGDTTTQSVQARVTLTRAAAPTLYPSSSLYPSPSLYPMGSPPSVSYFEMDVSVDASVDELVPIGMGVIDDVTTHATGGAMGGGSTTNQSNSTAVISQGGGQTGGGIAIKVHAQDLSYAIKRNVWQQPFSIPSGLLYTDAVKSMVVDRLPSQTAFNLSSTTATTPLLLYGAQQGGDPWTDVQELAAAIGFEAFFDATGVFVCRPVPDPSTGDPVWAFDETVVPLVAEAEFDLSSEQTFNDIVVVGQSTSSENPFSAEAYDNDSNSPTYILGPYGRVSERVNSSLITSQYQAQAMAYAALYASLGAANTVKLTVVPMPALEPGDIIKVVCGNVKADGTYMINSMVTPLSPADPQQLTCFRQSTAGTIGLAGAFSVTDGVTVSGSSTITSNTANFTSGDIGASVYGDGIPVNATIISVTNTTTAVISANATISATNVYIVVSVGSGT